MPPAAPGHLPAGTEPAAAGPRPSAPEIRPIHELHVASRPTVFRPGPMARLHRITAGGTRASPGTTARLAS